MLFLTEYHAWTTTVQTVAQLVHSLIFCQLMAYNWRKLQTQVASLSSLSVRKLSLLQRWATGWTIGVLGLDFWRGLGIFLFATASTTALGPTQPPIQWVPGTLYVGVKRPGRELHLHLVPRSKNERSYTSTPNTLSRRGAQLKKAQGQLFYFYDAMKAFGVKEV
jgi:hypothetical protein